MDAHAARRASTSSAAIVSAVERSGAVMSTTRVSVNRASRGEDRLVGVLGLEKLVDERSVAILYHAPLHFVGQCERAVLDREGLGQERHLLGDLDVGQI